MVGSRMSRKRITVMAVMLGLIVAVVAGQRLIGNRAFTQLEAQTISGDAHRVAVALSYETALLRGYGATNSIWDDSYSAVSTGSQADFTADFPPSDLVSIFHVNGAIGVDASGKVRVGGVVSGDAFGPLPAEMNAAALASMVDVTAKSGTSRCGVIATSASPYLYCGFPSTRSDGTASAKVGLIVLRTLDAAFFTGVSEATGMPVVAQSDASADGADHGTEATTLPTEIGSMTASTSVRGEDEVALLMSIPTLGGGSLTLTSAHPRPIHATDTSIAMANLVLMGIGAVGLLAMMLMLVRWSTQEQVAPLLATTEEIIASGDRALRLEAKGKGAIPALAGAINALLITVEESSRQIEDSRVEREKRVMESYHQQDETERSARDRAQEMVSTTVTTALDELRLVLENIAVVEQASREIGEFTKSADDVSAEVLSGVHESDRVLGDLSSGMTSVRGVTATITSITGQTHMLSLNAQIEATRVGAAGDGFNVVAQEMRALAASTASSAEEIEGTVAQVTQATTTMVSSIAGVSEGVTAVREASSRIRGAARRQQECVTDLVRTIQETIDKLSKMDQLAGHLERRDTDRVPVFGTGTLRLSGGTRELVKLRDVSGAGVQFEVPTHMKFITGQRVVLDVPPRLGGCQLQGTVAWTKSGARENVVGMTVTHADSSFEPAITALLADFASTVG